MTQDPEIQALLEQIETGRRIHRKQMRQLAHDHMRVVHPDGEPCPGGCDQAADPQALADYEAGLPCPCRLCNHPLAGRSYTLTFRVDPAMYTAAYDTREDQLMAIKTSIHKLAQLAGLPSLSEVKANPLPEDLGSLMVEVAEREQTWIEGTLSKLDSICSAYKLTIYPDSGDNSIVWIKPEATWTTVLELLRSTAISVGVLSREAVNELMNPAHYKAPREAAQAQFVWLKHYQAAGCCCYGAPHEGNCCPGWFENEETHEIERCDGCKLFDSDDEAKQAAQRA
jgi:hypothetical protein